MKVYRGYNKQYPNWGIRPNQLYIWTTADIDFAKVYTEEFENGGLVEFTLNENDLNIMADSEGEKLFGEDWWDFGGIMEADNEMVQTILNNGYNCVYIDDYGKDIFLLLDKNLIQTAEELPTDFNVEIEEVLKIAGINL